MTRCLEDMAQARLAALPVEERRDHARPLRAVNSTWRERAYAEVLRWPVDPPFASHRYEAGGAVVVPGDPLEFGGFVPPGGQDSRAGYCEQFCEVTLVPLSLGGIVAVELIYAEVGLGNIRVDLRIHERVLSRLPIPDKSNVFQR